MAVLMADRGRHGVRRAGGGAAVFSFGAVCPPAAGTRCGRMERFEAAFPGCGVGPPLPLSGGCI
jgi:hypothetical protein